jgi:hypothetical protein
MRFIEATLKVDSDDIGLMTFGEYIHQQNPDSKVHSSDSYDFDLDKLNRPYYLQTRMMSGTDKFRYHYNNRGGKIIKDDKIFGIIINNVLYTKKHQQYRINQNIFIFKDGNNFKEDTNIKLDKIQYVKYYDELIKKLDNTANKNLSRYNHVLNRFIDNDEVFSVRSEKPLEKNKGDTIAIINEEGYVIAMASNEWGATLLSVSKEYRGRSFGEKLGSLWYKVNPSFKSGGYTPQGYRNAKKLWSRRVRELLQNGVYSDLVKSGKITNDYVNEILSDLVPVEKKISKKKEVHTPDILILIDDFQFVIYDKKFFEEQSEDYVYAYGFVRDLPNGDLFPYRLDWDNRFKKLATIVMFTIEDEPLEIVHQAADFLEDIDQYSEIIKKGNKAIVDKKTRKMFLDLARYEKAYRSKNDKYGEIFQTLIEIANYKWD